MEQEQFQPLLAFFRGLGNESRLKIVGILANRECGVGELARLLDLKEPTVSHHLARLKELGLVDVRAEGNNRIYRLDVRALEAMSRDVFSARAMASLVEPDELDERQRVLKNFLDGERIKTIPAQRKKALFILEWLLERFEPGRRYPEREVNEIIKRHFHDFASLRRHLIEEGYMQRESGVYWRPSPA